MPGLLGLEHLRLNLQELIKRKGPPRWSERLVMNDQSWVNLVCDSPGWTGRFRFHPDSDEWWLVVQGEIIWDFGEHGTVHARAGDMVLAPRQDGRDARRRAD